MDYRVAAELSRRAAACAAHLPDPATEAAEAAPPFDDMLGELVHTLCDIDPRFMFDRKGRPDAVDTIRQAISGVEREMFDALLEDHACELAAVKAALLQVALAYGRSLARLSPHTGKSRLYPQKRKKR